MNLAIFFDAVAVAGRTGVAGEAKAAHGRDDARRTRALARFAHLIETFADARRSAC